MPNPPNILFFFPDQHRGDWMPGNGLPLRMPNLSRLMDRGVTCTRAYTPSPVCAPARACLASGRDYENCRVPSNRETYPLDLPTYYQRLRDTGYAVAGVGKFDLHKDLRKPVKDLDWGLDGSRCLTEWGFTHGIDNEGKLDGSASYSATGKAKGPYLHFLAQRGLADIYAEEHRTSTDKRHAYITALPADAYCDNWVAENGLAILRAIPAGTPWHMVVNFTGPHPPMDVTREMHDAWKDVDFPPPHHNEQENYSDEDHQRNRQHYAAMIENIDRQVGRFLDLVGERGELDNTLVVYSSDHGEMLGDHGRWGKSTYYEPSVNIPFVVAGPGLEQGRSTDALVVLHDLTATFLELAGAPDLPESDSRSLLPLLRGQIRSHRERVEIGLHDWRATVRADSKVVGLGDGRILRFDLANDPQEADPQSVEPSG